MKTQSERKVKHLKLENIKLEKDCLIILEKVFALTNIKITGKENSADQEAAHKFQVFIKTITKEKEQLPKKIFLTFIEIQLIYNVVFVSSVHQSYLGVYICMCMYIYFFFYILFHYILLQDTESSFLCYNS